jgi:hypothetical protein
VYSVTKVPYLRYLPSSVESLLCLLRLADSYRKAGLLYELRYERVGDSNFSLRGTTPISATSVDTRSDLYGVMATDKGQHYAAEGLSTLPCLPTVQVIDVVVAPSPMDGSTPVQYQISSWNKGGGQGHIQALVPIGRVGCQMALDNDGVVLSCTGCLSVVLSELCLGRYEIWRLTGRSHSPGLKQETSITVGAIGRAVDAQSHFWRIGSGHCIRIGNTNSVF